MRKLCILLVALSLGFITTTNAQDAPKPKSLIEVGVQGGVMAVAGDFDPKIGYGGGFHVRKSLDYLFSIRVDGFYGKMDGEKSINAQMRTHETTWIGGSILGVMSLNGLRWDKPVRPTNFYFMLGAGGNRFSTTYQLEGERNPREIEASLAPHMTIGSGISFRLSPRVNIGVESQAQIVFGNRADLLDGVNFEGSNTNNTRSRSVFRDIPIFGGISLNYNLGNIGNATEPLYWINPLDNVMKDIQEIKDRPEVSLEDSDGDGVIDALDQENNTPADAIVDVKGRTLDSDRDGVPDHQDKEPFYTPRADEQVNSEGVVIDPTTGEPAARGANSGVSEERVIELIQRELANYAPINDSRSTSAEWFLPMIHFSTDSYRVKYSDYGNLASISRTLQSNQGLRLAVIGFTDSTGDETTNNKLSYERAKAVIDHLVNQHGISRSRLVLQWKGSDDNLVPSTSSYMNRRVEMRVAGPGDFEMEPPASSGDGY